MTRPPASGDDPGTSGSASSEAPVALAQRRAWIPWLIFLLGLAALLPSVWRETSVTGSDEYTLSLRTPMEMAERGDWLTPWVNGEPRLRKPPLLYWLILSTYKLAGVSLLAARIWGVLAGAGLAVSACLLERELFRSTGLLAGLLTLSCLGVAAQARQAMLDLPLGLFVSLALLQGLRWLRTERLVDAAAAGGWLGLSFLMKGPVGLFFFGAGAVAALVCLPTRGVLRRHGWHWAVGLAVLAAISVPWPLLMQHLWADQFGRILAEELAARDFGRWHGKSPLSALGGALGLIAPWTPMVLGAMWTHFSAPRSARPAANAWLVTAFLLSVLPFFFMSAFERYMLAVVPIQAVLAARWLAPGGLGQRVTLRLAAGVLAVVAVAGAAFALWFHLGFIAPFFALALAVWIVREAFGRSSPWRVAALSTLLLTVSFGGVYPELGLNQLPEGIETRIGNRPVHTFDRMQPAMLSVRLGRSVQPLAVARVVAGRPELVWVDQAVRPEFERALREAGLEAREFTRFKTLYSRKAWARFARADATAADWQAAIRARSLDGLRTDIIGFEVSRPTGPP